MAETFVEAEGSLIDLVERVEHGEGITLTRQGRPAVKLVVAATVAKDNDLMSRIRRRRQEIAAHLRDTGQPPITTDEILGWVREGRR